MFTVYFQQESVTGRSTGVLEIHVDGETPVQLLTILREHGNDISTARSRQFSRAYAARLAEAVRKLAG